MELSRWSRDSFNTASAALLLLAPIALLSYDYVVRAPKASWQFSEGRHHSDKGVAERLPVLSKPDISAQEIISTVERAGGVRLRNTTVRGPLHLSLANHREPIIIAETVTFQDRVQIEAGSEYEAGPDSARFVSLAISNSQFLGPVELENSFYNVDLRDCTFARDLKFNGTFGIIDHLWLNGTTVEGDISFADIYPIHDLNLYDALLKGHVEFFSTFVGDMNTTRLRTHQPINIRWSQFGDGWLENSLSWAGATDQPHRREYVETGLMFWKNNFAQLGYERDERQVRFELIKFRRKYLSPSQLEWWATYVLEFPNGFGTSPYRPLWLGFLFVDIFAVLYWKKRVFVLKDPEKQAYRPPPLLLSLLYSLDTFIPVVTVTDVKTWGWEIAPAYKRLELVERVIGLVIFALSAYSIGSYVI